MKLTKSMWNDFLDMAVDASSGAGWKWFEEKYGFTCESFEDLLISNQKIVDELLKCYSECRSRQENLAISQFETNQQLFMEKLYKRATGKNIHEIQNQETV